MISNAADIRLRIAHLIIIHLLADLFNNTAVTVDYYELR